MIMARRGNEEDGGVSALVRLRLLPWTLQVRPVRGVDCCVSSDDAQATSHFPTVGLKHVSVSIYDR